MNGDIIIEQDFFDIPTQRRRKPVVGRVVDLAYQWIDTVLDEQQSALELRSLASQESVWHRKAQFFESQLQTRHKLGMTMLQAEAAESELRRQNERRRENFLPTHSPRVLIKQRLQDPKSIAPTEKQEVKPGPKDPFEEEISTKTIERLAMRAAMALGPREGLEFKTAWAAYKTKLYARLPKYAAMEVECRISEILASL